VEAKISAVHFKNGLSSGYGGAIRNDGLLTLESCIFSGNRNTAASATYGGGAVHSSKNLTIRGSAFYDNACSFSGIYGGAILLASTSSILTLTGNVFYGNTATSYPVVRVNSGSSVNASYNMVDKASGTGTAACGWSGGTGNVYSVNALPLSPKTFKLLYGSAAADVLPSPLPSVYPARDFYGQDISAFGSAGAVQAVTYNMSGYSYLDLSVNDSQRGSLSSSPTPDADGLVSNNTVTITATPAVASGNVSFVLSHWLVNGVKTPAAANQLTISVSAHTWVQAVFYRVVAVSGFNDSGAGTLREALTDLQEHDIIRLTGVTQGTTAIELTSALPAITKSLTIEGNGVTLTRASSWTDSSETSQLLYISGSSVEARIGAVHFKNGLSSGYGGAIRNAGILTLDSCIFSGNRNTATVTSYGGGAVYSDKTLTIRGCTFYDNACSSGAEGGAIYFTGSSYILTLTGNLFYGNTASYPVVRLSYGTVNASYNVVDKAAGTGTAACGWSGGTEDVYSVSVLPLLPKTFKVLYGSDATDALPSLLPSGYPAKDFYGQDISGSGATGAVQAITAPGYSYLDHLSVNDSLKGSVYVSSNPAPDADGLVPSSSITIAATPNASCVLSHWLVNEVKTPSTDLNELTISSLPSVVSVQAVFSRVVTVSSFNNAGTGTLREALTNLQEHDIIRLTGVTAGTTAIELTSALPAITKSLTIEGNGVTLTRASSWTVSAESQMLYISGGATVAKISAVHFKNGLSSGFGGAIRNAGILTLESCIFSGNRNTATSTIYSGGAVYSSGDLIIRGCTFYDNACSGSVYCGAIYAASSLTLTGNLFYRNTASSYPVVRVVGGKPINASYNVVDKASGTGATACGWAETAGTGNVYSLGVLPLSPVTFKLLYGSAAAGVVPSQSDYPAKDFYGQTISASGAAGAVQAMTASGYSYMDLSVNDSQRGSLSLNPAPDAEGLVPNGTVTITATPVISYIVSHWLVDDVETTGTVLNELTISVSAHTRIQAVFYRLVTVSNFADSGAGTLREALTNPQEHDIIRLTGERRARRP
jgi:hypothetical protein